MDTSHYRIGGAIFWLVRQLWRDHCKKKKNSTTSTRRAHSLNSLSILTEHRTPLTVHVWIKAYTLAIIWMFHPQPSLQRSLKNKHRFHASSTMSLVLARFYKVFWPKNKLITRKVLQTTFLMSWNSAGRGHCTNWCAKVWVSVQNNTYLPRLWISVCSGSVCGYFPGQSPPLLFVFSTISSYSNCKLPFGEKSGPKNSAHLDSFIFEKEPSFRTLRHEFIHVCGCECQQLASGHRKHVSLWMLSGVGVEQQTLCSPLSEWAWQRWFVWVWTMLSNKQWLLEKPHARSFICHACKTEL